MVGLTRAAANAVGNYSARLTEGALASGQTVDDLFESGTWDEKINAYTAAHLKMRAAVIARTELSFAGNEGQDMLWNIAIDEGVLNPDYLRRRLVYAKGFACPICTKIGEEEPVPFKAVFSNGKRNAPMHPNCVCRVVLVEHFED